MKGKYCIIASCDPYNAPLHYRGQEVIKKDGQTPVSWVEADGFETEDEAADALYELAKFSEEFDEGNDSLFDNAGNLVITKGDLSYENDTMSYWVSETEDL